MTLVNRDDELLEASVAHRRDDRVQERVRDLITGRFARYRDLADVRVVGFSSPHADGKAHDFRVEFRNEDGSDSCPGHGESKCAVIPRRFDGELVDARMPDERDRTDGEGPFDVRCPGSPGDL